MKKAYTILLVTLSVIVLSWFLPWLYSLLFPVGASDPFIAYSPISDRMIVSERTGEKESVIYPLDADGVREEGVVYTKEQRDSLLPQLYFTQLVAREQMPDSINGIEISIPLLKHNSWVFTSSPRDINKRFADVYLIMESMPARIDLEDPTEVFRFRDGRVEFIEMETNQINQARSKRFTEIFNDRGFTLPVKSFSANIKSRKAYDEGYLMVDDNGDIFHMKMQAGRPYMSKVRKPDSIRAAHVFIMENIDKEAIGLMSDETHNLYLIERDGYRLCQLPVGKVDPEKDRFSVVKNLFNIIVRVSNQDGTRWSALDADDYSLLASYAKTSEKSTVAKIGSYIFPYTLSFTSTSDCYATPRIESFSWAAFVLNAMFALVIFIVYRRRTADAICRPALASLVTLVFGIFAFIPFIIIRN